MFKADGNGGGSLFYDTNGDKGGFGDGGEILEIAEITGNATGLTVDDFVLIM